MDEDDEHLAELQAIPSGALAGVVSGLPACKAQSRGTQAFVQRSLVS